MPKLLRSVGFTVFTLLGFFLYGLVGVVAYPYFWITGFKPRQVRYFVYLLSWLIMHMLGALAKSMSVCGRLPAGPAVIVANHSSVLDILCFCLLKDPGIVFLAKSWPTQVPVMGRYVVAAGNICLRDGADFASLQQAAQTVFKQGLKLVIFPEGTRSSRGMGRFKSGAFWLAGACGVPVVPVALKGLGQSIPKNKIIVRSAAVQITVMDCINPFDITDQVSLKMAQDVRRRIIQKLEE